MNYFFLILLFVASVSCRDNGRGGGENRPETNGATQTINEKNSNKNQTFTSIDWGVTFEYTESFEVFEGELAPTSPVINIYRSTTGATPPLGTHADPEATYITLIPNGLGVDNPAGKRLSYREWEGRLPVAFSIDEVNSTVYLLENNEPWGFLLKFYQAPEKWKSHGSIYIQFGIKDFKVVCEDKEGAGEIPMKECDPMAGDIVKFFGEVKLEEREEVNEILRSLYFFSEKSQKETLQEMIQVELPSITSGISSPVEIKGKAKGYWFFEADAPVVLIDINYKLLARSHISAIGDWMTEDFVPFKTSLEFEEPSAKKGYLIFQRANASGLPEHDRALHIPVIFK